jgi:hypothetical protein
MTNLKTKFFLSPLSPLSLFISISLSLFISISLSFLFFTPVVHAAQFDASDALGFATQANTGGIGAENVEIEPLAGRIAKGVFSLGGLLFFLLVFYGGYTWLMARGEEEEIKKAQNIIIAACIGLFIMVGSYAITNFVLSRMIGGYESPKTQSGEESEANPIGCCLNKAQTPGGLFNVADPYWLSSIEYKIDCEEIVCNCSSEDELCGTEDCEFTKDVEDKNVCGKMAKDK